MKILVAEDEDSVRRSLVRLLNTLGYHDIGEAGDGLEALKLIRQSCPEIILADIRMPGINGLELLARATLVSSDIQCIFISGYDYFEYAQKAIALGASGYLLKPVKETELKSLLDKIAVKLEQSSWISTTPSDINNEYNMANYNCQETDNALNTASYGKEAIFGATVGNDLLNCLKSGDKDSANLLVDELFLPLKSRKFPDKNQLSKLDFQFLIQIYKALSQYGVNGEELLGEEFLLYKCLNGFDTIESTIQMFKDIFTICFDAIIASKEKAINKQIEKAKEYISENYGRDITQEGIADYVRLNASYFSRLFKQETGENFVDYLRNYRLNKSIELLKEGIYKANEVSHMVGFDNEKYFYKIFKKATGLTPSEIRKK